MAFSNDIPNTALRKTVAALALAAAAPLAMAAGTNPSAVTLATVASGQISGAATFGAAPSATDVASFQCFVTPTSGGPEVQITGGNCAFAPAAGDGGTTSFTFTIAGLTDGTEYSVRIATLDGGSAAGTGTTAGQTARPGTGPIPPNPLSGLGYSTPPSGGAPLVWTAPATWGAGGPLRTTAPATMNYEYECVEAAAPYTGTGIVLAAPATTVTPAIINDPAKTYKCQIRTTTEYGSSTWATINGIIPMAPFAIGDPTSVPTLGQWGTVILSLLLAASAVLLGRRRRF